MSAKTFVGQDIQNNQFWTKEKSPYIITKDIVIYPNAILNIQAGTEVIFSTNVRLIVEGAIWAVGSEKMPIIWKGLNDNSWNGILFRKANDKAAIDSTYSYFEYANFIGKNYVPDQLISVENRVVKMKFCKIEGCQTALQSETLGSIYFEQGQIKNTYRPINVKNTSFMQVKNSTICKFAVLLIGGSLDFSSNKVDKSLARGRYTGLVVWLLGGGIVNIVDNTFSKSAHTAFTLYKSSKKSTINLLNNTFQKNEINISISCEYAAKGNFIIKDNLFYKAKNTNILIFDTCNAVADTLAFEANYFHKLKAENLLKLPNLAYEESLQEQIFSLTLDFKGLLKEKPKFASIKKN